MGNHMKSAIEQMKRKEEAGLSYLYSKTYNYVYLRVKSILKKEEDIQQLMKEVYLQAFRSANELKEEEVYEWLGKRAYILGAQSYRKRKAREATCIELEKSDLSPRKGVNFAPSIEVICDVLEELPDLYQATFYAFYYDYMNVADIAEMMDCSIGVILNRLNYTAKYIKKAMEIYNEERKDKKEKAYFSIEIVCAALRKWSVDHCLGMASAQTLYSNLCKELKLTIGSIYLEGKEFAGVNNTVVYHKADDMSALLEEIAFYEKKESIDLRKLVMIGGAAAALILLILIGVAVFGGKDEKKEEKKPPVTGQENEEADQGETDSEGTEQGEDESGEAETKEPESEGNEPQTDAEYILPTSDTVELTEADLQSLSKEQLRLARNEIYARHGMIFGVEDLDSYFKTKSWYQAKYSSSQFYDAVEMTMIEEANINLILSVEQSR
ncbi:MAG: YARHG domain-containing protein [Tyzzerella sp.]|nr:YARHG domain-containing protein [Tyzzerella sp.]